MNDLSVRTTLSDNGKSSLGNANRAVNQLWRRTAETGSPQHPCRPPQREIWSLAMVSMATSDANMLFMPGGGDID